MKTKMIWANLAVSDIQRTTKFYLELGCKQNGTPTKEVTSFLFSESGFVIHFFIKERFRNDVNGMIADVPNGNEIIFSLSAGSKEEVDEWAEMVTKAGGTIYTQPSAFDKGYTCGFADPDGHKFNVLYWPG
jgi:uncharacterized protein